MNGIVRPALAIAANDLRMELRGRRVMDLVIPFAMALLVILGLSFGPGRTALEQAAPAAIWTTMLLSALLSLRSGYEADTEDDALEELLLSPVDRAAIYLGKAGALAVELVVLAAGVVVLTTILFQGGTGILGAPSLVAIVLGSVGIAAAGHVFAAVTVRARGADPLLPLLVLPVCAPVIVAGVQATAHAAAGEPAAAWGWVGPLAAFALLTSSVGVLAFEHVVES
jgi:heme exporter protein B